MFGKIRELLTIYAVSGTADKSAVQNYMDCENEDTIRSLRNELTGVASGNFPDEMLKPVLTEARSIAYGSYSEWAKRMLLWMAEYRR